MSAMSNAERALSEGASNRGAMVSEPVRLRLTRRGRVVVSFALALVVGVVFAIATLFLAPHAEASSQSSATEFGYVVVAPGESLWSLASALDPSTDPREVIAEIVQLNQLESSAVQAGEPIAVPLKYRDVPGVVSAAELGLDA